MKISRIIIKKFRSIEKADIWVDSISAIVGQNNAGKSCLLRALNAFFNFEEEVEAFERGVHSFSTRRSVAKIEIHFQDPDQTKTPSKYIFGNKIVVEISFNKTNSGLVRTIKFKKGSDLIEDPGVLEVIKSQIDFILIPPNRDAGVLNSLESSVLRLLIEEKMKAITDVRDNYTAKFRLAIDYLEANALKKVSDDIKNEFPISKKFKVDVRYDKDITYKDFLPDVGVNINEFGLSHSLSECGSGIQSLIIVSLYTLLGKARDKNVIVGLEEPENNLHPQAQKELITYFKDLVSSEGILQLFFTTHSSQMIDQVDHTDVILFKKVPDDSRGFVSKVSKLPRDFYDIYSLDRFKYYQFFRYRNSEFFFSSYIVLTESKNEIEVIKKIGDRYGNDYEVDGLSYLNLEGVGKSKYAYYLLKELNIPFLFVVDKDFFCSYLNDDFYSSLNPRGFPIYKSSFTDEDFIKEIVTLKGDRDLILRSINNNHTGMLNILERYNVVCMRWSLDIDLVAVEKAKNRYCDILRLPSDKRTTVYLTSQRKAIKQIDRILDVFSSLEPNNWPYSFSRIKKVMDKVYRKR